MKTLRKEIEKVLNDSTFANLELNHSIAILKLLTLFKKYVKGMEAMKPMHFRAICRDNDCFCEENDRNYLREQILAELKKGI